VAGLEVLNLSTEISNSRSEKLKLTAGIVSPDYPHRTTTRRGLRAPPVRSNQMPVPTEVEAKLTAIKILPKNSASESKGSIHDDEKAREMGYKGGLVPGVTVLGYMSQLMQETFGQRWQSGSTFKGRLRRPVYEGAEVAVEGTVVEAPAASNENTVTVELKVIDADGVVAAFAQATCKL
jgi:hypothetical protein